MDIFISRSPATTEEFAERFAATLTHGNVVGLAGGLGAGKTQFVKGLARGLGISEPVHSPTFSLVNCYEGGRLPLFHLDLYRLDTQKQIEAAGLAEYFAPDGVAVIEWIDRWRGPPPAFYHSFRLETVSEAERHIYHEFFGP